MNMLFCVSTSGVTLSEREIVDSSDSAETLTMDTSSLDASVLDMLIIRPSVGLSESGSDDANNLDFFREFCLLF